MKKVVIYKTQKSPTQSGLKKSDLWIMESFDTSYHEIDPLTGWIGTENNDHTIRLKFSSKEEAMAYAKEKHLYTEIIEESKKVFKKKSYADNFKYNRIKTDIF